jgi:ATP-independent RNA helicase DbpA
VAFVFQDGIQQGNRFGLKTRYLWPMLDNILKNFQIQALNPMQEAVLKATGSNANIILLSPTGSGKTLGFLIPLVRLLKKESTGVQALILVPSRELALQIEQVFRQMGTGFKVNCFYGGHSAKVEKNSLSEPPAVLIGTPGRIAWHLRNQTFDASSIHSLVLDEFDKSLEFGFQEDMANIIGQLEHLQKRFLTSATKMDEIPSFLGVSKLTELNFLNDSAPTEMHLKLHYLQAPDTDKLQMLLELVCFLQNKATIVFCNHRDAVERISMLLAEQGLAHGIFHGGMEQEDRERALIKFRNGSYTTLITTDLASRGLDIPEIEAVIHYQLPPTLEVFTHRNGRTARMNAHGTAWLLLSATDYLPEFLPETPELFTLPESFDLPESAVWRTVYIGGGRKDKVNKMDIVGMFLQKGKLAKEDLGRIEVLDHSAYAAVKAGKIEDLIQRVKAEKIKNKAVKIAISH